MLNQEEIANWAAAPPCWAVPQADAAPKRLAKASVADAVAQGPDATDNAMADAGVRRCAC